MLQSKPQLTIFPICKGYELSGSKSKEYIRPTIGNLFFPFGNSAFQAQATAFADAVGRFFNDFEKKFVIFGGVHVVDPIVLRYIGFAPFPIVVTGQLSGQVYL
ncbi:hypothetical protein [uncultured Maribacter sp.]|uniref:hypothetical protein n=1 Tax=uncultured Maribacter sp. TaxID=431308 RepID=UPI0030D6D7E2|tara:strand:- start:269 stop:577 length:309 start_codon:yes stop_codon:yes gene_type:complete